MISCIENSLFLYRKFPQYPYKRVAVPSVGTCVVLQTRRRRRRLKQKNRNGNIK